MGLPRPAAIFSFTLVPRLPRLAWLLELEHGFRVARVLHGEWVETREDGFFEGGWAGEFSELQFDKEFMTGTGAKLRDGSLLLVAPNHTLDRICVLKKGTVTFVSNSLPCVLAASNEHVDEDFLLYDSYVASIRHGLRKYERVIPTKSKNSVKLYYGKNVLVTGKCEFKEEPKKASPKFANYRVYREYLDKIVRTIALNASHAGRNVRYAPMASISRGYDSPAAAVLARSAGCDSAVSFRESRGGAAGEDCGTEIAKLLCLSVKEFGRLDYRNSGDFPEIRNSGGPSEFLSFGEYLRGTLFFTGFNGDMIWNKNANSVSSDLIRTDASGTSLTEYRLDAGFIHLPVPFIAADSHPSIHEISNSQEMAKWAVGGTYDRPIARRIVEEAGVARHLFGQIKRAAGVVVTSEGLKQTMSETSFSDYNLFLRGRWTRTKALEMYCYRAIKKVVSYNELLRRIVARMLRAVGIRGFEVPFVIPQKLRMLSFGYIGRESLLFHWGMNKLIERYQAALSAKT